MAKLRSFIRGTSPKMLRAYFQQREIEIPSDVHWSLSGPALTKSLFVKIDQMDARTRARIIGDAERVEPMVDEAGQIALKATVSDVQSYERIESAHDRALWMLVNHQAEFRRAEEIRYTDAQRRRRMWVGYVTMPNLEIKSDAAAIRSFRDALSAYYQTENVKVEIFDRIRESFDGNSHTITQISIYREGMPSDELAFDTGEIVHRTRRPVVEAALTYEPESGVIEVVAKDKEYRLDLARIMSRDLMDVDFKANKLPLKKYDLGVLMSPCAFAVDAEDGIESVTVRLLRLMPLDGEGQRITLECMSNAGITIWSMSKAHFGAQDPLAGPFMCTQARVIIKFRPGPGASRGRTMDLTVTMPHGCNMRDGTPKEQAIGEKYLKRWKLLEEA